MSSRDPRIGTEMRGYRIELLVGRGAMGVVYRATDLRLERRVALKLIAPELAEDPDFRGRFLRESQLAASLDHPAVVPIYEAGEADGQLYIAMRYVEGSDLKTLLAEAGRLPPERTLAILGQVADALDAAHRKGFVHRDVKPANILLDEAGHAYLTDFGLSKQVGGASTHTGRLVGTLDYLAPEQISGEGRDGRVDQYALACVLYECLAGQPPFRRQTEAEVLWAQMHEAPASIADRPAVDAVLGKALSKAREDRYSTCGELVAAARQALWLDATDGVATIMFTDVEGSTALADSRGDRQAKELIETQGEIVRDSVAKHGGRVIDSIGDGFMVAFDSTRRALACATEIHDLLQERARANPDRTVRLRIGLNVGEVLERDGHPFGAAVNAAARIAAVAKGGEIVVSDAVRQLAGTIPGIAFRDRGRLRLKGFREPWRLYDVQWGEQTQQRAARRLPVRPRGLSVSRRRAGVLVGLACVLVAAASLAAVLVSGGDESSPRLLPPNVVGILDAKSGALVGQVSVGADPGPIAVGRGAVWVANLADDTISRIDPRTHSLVRTLAAGEDLKGLAARGDAVWAVAGSGAELIDPGFDSVARHVRLERAGGAAGPPEGAVAVGDGGVFVSNGSSAIARLAPVSGRRVGLPVDVGNSPSAIAVGAGATWVSDSQDDTVARIDPTGLVTTIQVGHGAGGIAVGAGAIWVTNTGDGTVTRIRPEGAVDTTIPVGGAPRGIAVGDGAVWVANSASGSVLRIDPRTNRVTATIAVGQSPQGVAVVGGSVWVTLQAGQPASLLAAGGTVRVAEQVDPGPVDPARLGLQGDPDTLDRILGATCAKLLNYPDRPAPHGRRVEPEVALAMPSVSDVGRRYTYILRPGFRFSPPSNAPVTAGAFAREIERVLNPRTGSYASTFMGDIVGASAYVAGRARHVAGVTARGNRLTIELTHPASTLPVRLATPYFCAVPPGTPIARRGVDVPAAGPYYVASHASDQAIVLRRNPNYHGARPHRPDAIVVRFGSSSQRAVADVLAGRTDYASAPPVSDNATLTARFGAASRAAREGHQQYFVNPTLTLWYLVMNTRRPLFAHARLRGAVNYAIDRRALAQRLFPDVTGRPTDQYLPPGTPGFRDAAIYPLGGPDLARARRLAAGTHARAVLYTCNLSPCPQNAQLIKSELRAIGIAVEVRLFPLGPLFQRLSRPSEPYDLADVAWLVDYVDPANFINLLFGPGPISQHAAHPTGNYGGFRDPRFIRRIKHASRLSGAARLRAYGALDVALARRAAPVAAIGNGTARDLFSARIGCQVYQPIYGMDLATLCVRRR